MSDQIPETGLILSVTEDLSGAQRFVAGAREAVTELEAIAASINRLQWGNPSLAREGGEALGRAVLQGLQEAIHSGTSVDLDSILLRGGGDEFRREMQGRADAVSLYARSWQQLGEVVARARALGVGAAQPALSAGPSVGSSVARQTSALESTARLDDRLDRVVRALEQGRSGTGSGGGAYGTRGDYRGTVGSSNLPERYQPGAGSGGAGGGRGGGGGYASGFAEDPPGREPPRFSNFHVVEPDNVQTQSERDRADRAFRQNIGYQRQANEEEARRQREEQLRAARPNPSGSAYQRFRTTFLDPHDAYSREDGTTVPARGTFGEEFRKSLVGRDNNIGGTIGQGAKFAVLYGGLYQALGIVTQAFSASATEAVAFEDSMVQLNLANGRSREANETLAGNLGKAAASAGLAPSAGVAAGAQAIGLFDVATASAAQQDLTAQVTTEVAARIARVSGGTLDATTTQIVGAARSFGIGAAGLPGLEDSLAYLSHQSGRPVGELLPAIANVGTLAGNAGFSAEEVGALVTQVTGTTGQTAGAVAGGLRQVLSRSDDPSFNRKISEQTGIDTTGKNLHDIIAEFAKSNPTTEAINRFSLLFGRGSSQQVAQILTRDYSRVEGLAAGARDAAGTGEGRADFEATMATIGNQVRLLGSHLLELGKDLAETGVADFLYLVVKAADAVVQVLDHVVTSFNLLPRPLRDVGLAIGELALIANFAGGGKVAALYRSGAEAASAGAATALGRRTLGTGAAELESGALLALTSGSSGAAARVGGAAAARTAGQRLLGGLGGLADASKAALLSPAGLIVGGGLLAAGAYQATQRADVSGQAVGLAENAYGLSRTAKDFTNAADVASLARKRADAERNFDLSTLGLSSLYQNTIGGSQSRSDAAASLEAGALGTAKRLEAVRAASVTTSPEAAFGSFGSLDDVTAGLKDLTDRGFTAAQRLGALNSAFDQMISKSSGAATSVATIFKGQGTDFAEHIGAAATSSALGDSGVTGYARNLALVEGQGASGPINAIGGLYSRIKGSGQGARVAELNEFAQSVDSLDQNKLREDYAQATLQTLSARGKDPAKGPISLDQGDEQAIQKALAEVVERDYGPLLKSIKDPKLREQMKATLVSSVTASVRSTLGDFNGTQITAENINAYITGAIPEAQAAGAELGAQKSNQTVGAEATLANLLDVRAHGSLALTTAKTPQERKAITTALQKTDSVILQAQKDLGAQQRSDIDSIAALSASKLTPENIVGRGAINITSLHAKLKNQIDSGADVRDITATRAALNDANRQQQRNVLAATQSNELAGIDPRNALLLLTTNRSQVQARRDQLNEHGSVHTQAYGDLSKQLAEYDNQVAQYALNYVNALDLSRLNAGDVSGQLSAAINDAQRRLADAQAGGDPLSIARAETARKAAIFAGQQYSLDAQAAQRSAQYSPSNRAAAVGGDLVDAQARLALARQTTDPLAIAQAQIARQAAQQASRDYNLDLTASSALVNVRPGDAQGQAVAARRDAQRRLTEAVAHSDQNAANEAFNAVQAAIQQERQVNTSVRGDTRLAYKDSRDKIGIGQVSLRNLSEQRDDAGAAGDAGAVARLSSQINQQEDANRRSQVERTNAVIGARAAGNDDRLVQATAAVAQARNNLGLELQGQAAYADALAALKNSQRALALAVLEDSRLARVAGIDPRDSLALARDATRTARDRLRTDLASHQGAGVINQDRIDLAAAANQQRQEYIATQNSRIGAGVAGNDGQVAQARAALQQAANVLGGQLAGTKEYYDALAAYQSAQRQLALASLAYANTARRVGTDLTNPLIQAQLDVQAAAEKLAADQASGQGSGVINQDKLDLTTAQNSAEATAFSQKLQAAQTADQLGRSSHDAYLTYLNNEHDRLTAITNRTYQQQQELDQIDGLIKGEADASKGQSAALSAARKAIEDSFQGQWNIGDIKVPTAYEMKRALSVGGSGTGGGYVDNRTASVTINGGETNAMIAAVFAALNAQLGTALSTSSGGGL